jgi:hypothetical protein
VCGEEKRREERRKYICMYLYVGRSGQRKG